MAAPRVNTEADGLIVQFQGYDCSPIHEYSRHVGLEPSFGYVHVAREDFQAFKIVDGDGSQSVEQLNFFSVVAAPKEGFRPFGDLLIAEIVDGKPYSTFFRNVLVAEKAVESLVAVDDASDVARIELTDIRLLWEKRGLVFGWINVPQQGYAQFDAGKTTTGTGGSPDPEPDPAPLDPLGFPTTVSPKPAIGNGASGGSAIPMIPGSTSNGGGGQWTLRQVLEIKILPNLFGKPPLRRLPPDLESAKPGKHIWNGVWAKDALREIMEEFGLVLALNPDSSVSFWKEGEGDLQDSQLVPIATDDDRITSNRFFTSYHYTPSIVLVLGPPIIDILRKGPLEACGEEVIGEGKTAMVQVSPLPICLSKIGLDKKAASRYCFLTQDNRGAFTNVAADGMHAFDRWGFKWYRLPGGPAANSDVLPIEDLGYTDKIGVRAEPRVFSTGSQPFLTARLSRGRRGTGDQARALASRVKSDTHKTLVNLELRKDIGGGDGEYKVDRERGIVQFADKRVEVIEEGLSIDESEAKEAQVFIEFGSTRKASFKSDLRMEDRYFSVWRGLFEKSTGKYVGPQQIDAVPKDVVPEAVFASELQQFVAQDKTTNKTLLDGAARKYADGIFRAPKFTEGFVVEMNRPVEVVNTGRVKSIVWRSEGDGVPNLTLHLGAKAPGAPIDNRTATGVASQDSAAPDSVFVPKALRQ